MMKCFRCRMVAWTDVEIFEFCEGGAQSGNAHHHSEAADIRTTRRSRKRQTAEGNQAAQPPTKPALGSKAAAHCMIGSIQRFTHLCL